MIVYLVRQLTGPLFIGDPPIILATCDEQRALRLANETIYRRMQAVEVEDVPGQDEPNTAR